MRDPLSWLAERVENVACRLFSALVAATPAIAGRLRTFNGNTVVVQNFALLDEVFRTVGPSWDQRSLSVAYVGGITENRGIREMVEAMGLLPQTCPADLKLAGSFSPAELRDRMVQLRGWERVEELGILDRGGVARLLMQVRAGLVVLGPEPRYEVAYPVKMFEYMSAGIPVIASDFPLWRQIIEGAGCGLLVDPIDPKAIAHAIEYLLTHPQEAEAMGRRGREAVAAKYNWDREEKKLLELYAAMSV
jgi:glycosyltransferase involved in cell wall biosynthesis